MLDILKESAVLTMDRAPHSIEPGQLQYILLQIEIERDTSYSYSGSQHHRK